MGNSKPADTAKMKKLKGTDKAKEQAKTVDKPKIQMRMRKLKGSSNIETKM